MRFLDAFAFEDPMHYPCETNWYWQTVEFTGWLAEWLAGWLADYCVYFMLRRIYKYNMAVCTFAVR